MDWEDQLHTIGKKTDKMILLACQCPTDMEWEDQLHKIGKQTDKMILLASQWPGRYTDESDGYNTKGTQSPAGEPINVTDMDCEDQISVMNDTLDVFARSQGYKYHHQLQKVVKIKGAPKYDRYKCTGRHRKDTVPIMNEAANLKKRISSI
jgi:hypothetical protein